MTIEKWRIGENGDINQTASIPLKNDYEAKFKKL